MNKKKILLLDDDSQIRFNFKIFFEDEGFKCDAFSNSLDALNSLENNHYDIAVVDIRLPGMDGEEFIAQALNINPRLKYIIHTGSTQYKIPDKLKNPEIKIADVFHKPILDMNLFAERINQILNNEESFLT